MGVTSWVKEEGGLKALNRGPQENPTNKFNNGLSHDFGRVHVGVPRKLDAREDWKRAEKANGWLKCSTPESSASSPSFGGGIRSSSMWDATAE